MSPPVFLVPTALLTATAGSVVVVDGAEGRHAVTVRRLRPGEPVVLSDGAGLLAHAQVSAVDPPARLLAEVHTVTNVPAPQPRLVVVQALPKGDRGELAAQLLTEVGVDEVIPWSADRCVTRWEGPRRQRGVDRWATTAREAAKQSRRAWFPVVSPLHDTTAVCARLEAADVALVLHEDATEGLAGYEPPSTGQIVIVVGPEGGISPDELARFITAGARPVRLGAEVLRTSTAGAVALAVLNAASRWRAPVVQSQPDMTTQR